MVSKSHTCVVFVATLLAMFTTKPVHLQAQVSGSSGFIENLDNIDNTGQRFFQRLAWNEDSFAFRYEVIIEKEEGQGRYRQLMRDSTTTSYIDVFLSPGNYRYQVIPYDFLDHRGSASQWMQIEILNAIDPEQHFVHRLEWTADRYARYYEVEIETEIKKQGNYKTFVRALTSTPFINVSLPPGNYRGRVIPYDFLDHPLQAALEGDSQWVWIEVSPAVPDGEYEIPEERKLIGIYLGAAWMPQLRIYGESLFGDDVNLAGAATRFGFVFSLRDFSPGLELAASLHGFNDFVPATFGVNFLAQKELPGEKALINLRFGGGISFLTWQQIEYDYNTNIGLSFLLRLSEHFYMETGFDYVHLFTPEYSGEPSGWLRPWLGAGLYF